MNDITTALNMLEFYNLTKEFFSKKDFSQTPQLVALLNRVITQNKIIVIHNHAGELVVYGAGDPKEIALSELVDALPLLFQSYSFSKVTMDDAFHVCKTLNLSHDGYKDAAYFSIDMGSGESLCFLFLNPDSEFTAKQEAAISDIGFFLEDITNFSTNVSQGEALAEKLRTQKKKQSVWLESLAWLNELGNQEYSDQELLELYNSALFQLKTLVRADNAVAFLVKEDNSFASIVSYGEEKHSRVIEEILLDGAQLNNFSSQTHVSMISSDNLKLAEENIEALNLYPLFVQGKLKLILSVCKNDTRFEDHENMIATLFSEGLEHIIERMYFLRAMRQQNQELKKEQEEQKVLIAKLRNAQEQLLNNEKMASIGQLAAGVAHEINNPVGYVNSNINSLDGYVTDIYDVLDVYQTLEQTIPEENEHRKKLKDMKSDIDFDFIRDDIKELISESKEGVLRVKQIVKDLKDFSHVDEAEWQVTDLEKGIDSTLNIVHNELKYKAKIHKSYGDIPTIECVPSQINQIIMNLLVNAGHAIDEQGTITIQTGTLEDKYIFVDIIDTGKGIAPENLNKIFDPFFTTKPVGQGTGLGLSLSYSIAEKHGGELSVNSVVGEGTTFRLRLPIKKEVEPTETIEH